MVADNKGKKLKAADKNDEENADQIDGELVLSIEKLQEIQDDLEKVPSSTSSALSLFNYALFVSTTHNFSAREATL